MISLFFQNKIHHLLNNFYVPGTLVVLNINMIFLKKLSLLKQNRHMTCEFQVSQRVTQHLYTSQNAHYGKHSYHLSPHTYYNFTDYIPFAVLRFHYSIL